MSGGPFVRDGDGVTMRLHAVELDALRLLLVDLARTLDEAAPDDAVIARLAPDPAPTDPDLSRDLRDLVASGVADDRRRAVDAISGLLGRAQRDGDDVTIDLAEDEPWLLLGVLNDLRLAIGARIGIVDLDRGALRPDDERRRAVAAMDHFGWWQWHLIRLMDPDSAAAAEASADGPTDDGAPGDAAPR